MQHYDGWEALGRLARILRGKEHVVEALLASILEGQVVCGIPSDRPVVVGRQERRQAPKLMDNHSPTIEPKLLSPVVRGVGSKLDQRRSVLRIKNCGHDE